MDNLEPERIVPMRKHKEVEAPTPETGKVVPDEGYIYTGEKNYEAPKPDPWTEETK